MSVMHLVFVSPFSYPDGGAAAARHVSLARGLAASGHRVTFVLLNQAELPDPALGAPGIHWTTVAREETRSSPLGWRGRVARRLGAAIDGAAVSRPVDAILVLTRDPVVLEIACHVGRTRRTPVIHELTEYPDVVARPGLLGGLSQWAYRRWHLRQLDGVLVITHALDEYVRTAAEVPTQVLGAIVDTERLARMPPLALTGTLRVGYAGSLSQQKDGVRYLVSAVHDAQRALGSTVAVHLDVLGGDLGSAEGRALRRTVADLGLGGAVTLYGQVPSAQVREVLSRSHVMALPRPASRQATGGFPTKLGEYLATGRPVVTTAVGEIPLHLRDGDTCFMVPPDDIAGLAGAFVRVAEDYAVARDVGERGRLLTESAFRYVEQAGVLADFAARLRGTRP
jgi:glycosyltransferase involved in cell wall biosynthesis